jgi:polysaccharide biosynthesis/export protein
MTPPPAVAGCANNINQPDPPGSRRRGIGLACALLALSLTGCAAGGPAGDAQFVAAATSLAAQKPAAYRIGASDVLKIRVLGEPELSSDAVTVSQNGTIEMLLLNEVSASGMTTAELAETLRDRLNARFLVDPKVSVSLVSSARLHVVVEGEVKKPGVFPLGGEMRLMQAIALAEGPTDVARLKDVVVIRQQDGQRLAARFNLKSIRTGETDDPYLMPQDTVVVGQSIGSIIYRDLVKNLPSLTSMFVVIGRD